MTAEHAPMTAAEIAAVVDRHTRSPDRRVDLIAGLYLAAEVLTDRFLADFPPGSDGYDGRQARDALRDLETLGRQAGLAVGLLSSWGWDPPHPVPTYDAAEDMLDYLAWFAGKFGRGDEGDGQDAGDDADAPAVVEGGAA